MADAAKGVNDYMGENIVYISVMNRLSVDCDCDGNPAEPDMHDIGILAPTDPLAEEIYPFVRLNKIQENKNAS